MQTETPQDAQNPADTARVRLVEALLADRSPSADDLCDVGAEFLRGGDFLDAGLEIRSLQQAAARMQEPALCSCLWRLATLVRPQNVDDSKVAARIRTLHRWIWTTSKGRSGPAWTLISDLLKADDLIRLRLSGAKDSAGDRWSDWALEAALGNKSRYARLVGSGAARVAEGAARRKCRERELAQMLFESSPSPTSNIARSLRRLLATARAGGSK